MIMEMENYYGNYNWRGKFFNNIIKKLEYSSYLELGVSTGLNCWSIVECQNKVGVDANPNSNLPEIVCKYTDDYFSSLNGDIKFDLIYIDACHEKYQVYRDFCNSIKHLKKDGMIILHDILPLTQNHTCINTLNGNVYEMWIDLVKNYPKQTATFIGFPGEQEGTVGIYFGNEFDETKIAKIDYSYEYFFKNFPEYIYHKTLTEEQIIWKAKYCRMVGNEK
jgi:hypothetical protein